MPALPVTPRRLYTGLISTLACSFALVACGGDGGEPTPVSLGLESIGQYQGGAAGAAEITAYDATSKRLFVVNGANGTVDVLDMSDPGNLRKISSLDVSAIGDSANSVAVHSGLVAVAVQARPKTQPGSVVLYDATSLARLHTLTVGAQPDMLSFTPDGTRIVVANEGEPNSYGQPDSVDPEGSVSIIAVNRGATPAVATADFRAFIGRESELRTQGVRIYGPGANAAQDFEPEYITISADSSTAYVTLQENNALATVDLGTARVLSVRSLGTKDHSLAGMGLDLSDEDGGTNTNSGTPTMKIATYPVKGMYMPDAIASFSIGGQTYLVTANEGDTRADWPGFNEETRVRAHCDKGLDPAVFTDAANQVLDSNLGRLRITTTPFGGGTTGKNSAGQCTELFSFGARSFSIWDTQAQRVFDSGDQFEQRTRALTQVKFNASNDNDTLDSRSPSKGPEPEGLALGRIGSKVFAFIGLERVGGVMVYDVASPTAPTFVTYYNGSRSGAAGDLGPEGVLFIPADQSPNRKPLLVVGNEVSGNTRVLQINATY